MLKALPSTLGRTTLLAAPQTVPVAGSRDEMLDCNHHITACDHPHPSYDRSYISTTHRHRPTTVQCSTCTASVILHNTFNTTITHSTPRYHLLMVRAMKSCDNFWHSVIIALFSNSTTVTLNNESDYRANRLLSDYTGQWTIGLIMGYQANRLKLGVRYSPLVRCIIKCNPYTMLNFCP